MVDFPFGDLYLGCPLGMMPPLGGGMGCVQHPHDHEKSRYYIAGAFCFYCCAISGCPRNQADLDRFRRCPSPNQKERIHRIRSKVGVKASRTYGTLGFSVIRLNSGRSALRSPTHPLVLNADRWVILVCPASWLIGLRGDRCAGLQEDWTPIRPRCHRDAERAAERSACPMVPIDGCMCPRAVVSQRWVTRL